MLYKIIDVPIEGCIHISRQFCTAFSDAYLTHINPTINDNVSSGYITVIHNGKKVRAGIDKEIQKAGRRDLVYYDIEDKNTDYDCLIEEDIFLLHDEASLNYAHFFFDYFGRCLYFDELKKQNPNLKLGLLEDFYKEEGNNSYTKEWLDLYYQDKNVDIIIFKKDKKYKINSLILPNVLYWFPEGYGDDPIVDKIIEVAAKIPPIEVKTNGCYISRQDTIKRGWYHKRELKNELELIESIKKELNYDIIELMDYNLKEKIQIFKSYKNIIHQSSASNINVLFSTPNNNNIIISHPIMEGWLNFKCNQFAIKSGVNLLTLDGGGECISTLEETGQTNKDNLPWKLNNIKGLIEILKQIDTGDIWKS
jgi:hypothetical protein